MLLRGSGSSQSPSGGIALPELHRRLRWVALAAIAAFLILIGRLWQLQVMRGEGYYERFRGLATGAHEIHSSLASIVFCYGIVGALLFFTFAFSVLRGASLRDTLTLVPAIAYGLSHQGLRFTLFWVLLAIFAIHTATRKSHESATQLRV